MCVSATECCAKFCYSATVLCKLVLRCVAQSCVSYSIKAIEIPMMKFYQPKLKNVFIIISFSLIQYISLFGKMFCFAVVVVFFFYCNWSKKRYKMSTVYIQYIVFYSSVYSVFYFLSVFDNKKNSLSSLLGLKTPRRHIPNNIFQGDLTMPNREIVWNRAFCPW